MTAGPATGAASSARARGACLALLSAAFLARVLGQLAARLASPRLLPAFDAWHSGLLPYPLLLAAQIAVLAWMARVLRDVALGGPLARPRPRLARALRRASLLYAAAMLLRYPVTMALSPESRWTGGAIPIAFHLVLAAWLSLYAGDARGRASSPRPRRIGCGACDPPAPPSRSSLRSRCPRRPPRKVR